jgi:hypothetical protein
MSFLFGFALPTPRTLETVGYVTIKDIDDEETIHVTCFPDTGTLFFNGKFAPTHLTIRDSLGWYTGEPVMDIDIEHLSFQTPRGTIRKSHEWEQKTVLHSHWKAYAKNRVCIFMTIRIGDQNESIFILGTDNQEECLILTP